MSESLPPGHYWQLLQRLEDLHDAGVQQLPKPKRAEADPRVQQSGSVRSEPVPAAAAKPATKPLESTAASESITPKKAEQFGLQPDYLASGGTQVGALQVLREEVSECTRCQELASTRTQTVFGVGDPQARLCFMGEAPGADEDRQGEPFVGRAGQLLNKILEACQLRRDDVYILNVLKCRPPNNRNPTPEESQNCRGFLNRQLELISPEFICCLGAVAAQNLLGTTEAIGRLRGKLHEYRGVKVVCTYHPAYLLRTPSAKKHTWDDMKFLMRLMGTPVD